MPVSRRRRGRAATRAARSGNLVPSNRRKKTNKLYLVASVVIAVLVISSFAFASFSGGGVCGARRRVQLCGPAAARVRAVECPRPARAAAQASLERAGIRTFSDLLRWERRALSAKFGSLGDRLWHLARGEDRRRVSRSTPIKSISNETTFHQDTADRDLLDGHLWRMCEKVSDRAKAKGIAGRIATLKLKTSTHKGITKRVTLRDATQLADTLYRALRDLLEQLEPTSAYRLIGAGLSDLCDASEAERSYDLLDPLAKQRGEAERATDAVRKKFGTDAIVKGRALR